MAVQNVPGSYCTFPSLVLQSAIPSKALIPRRRMVLVTSIWALVILNFLHYFSIFENTTLRTLLSEINWSQKDKHCMIALRCGIRNSQMQSDRKENGGCQGAGDNEAMLFNGDSFGLQR